MRRQFKVLVIDDDLELLDVLRVSLSVESFNVLVAPNAISGLRLAYKAHPDIILLDVMMPEMDGFEVCRRLREMSDVPIIFLTAQGTIEDVVHGFSAGADDYIVKPFDLPELLCRLRVLLRRAAQQEQKDSDILFVADSVMLDYNQHKLVLGNRTVHLTPIEFDLLRLLIRYHGKVLSTEAILAHVWGTGLIGDPDLVKQYIYRLRQKIEEDPKSPHYLHTVWGEGYYFDAEDIS